MDLLSSAKRQEGEECSSYMDRVVGWGAISVVVLVQVKELLTSLWSLRGLTAFAVVKTSNDLAGLVIALLLFVTWDVLCYSHNTTRNFLKFEWWGVFPKGMMRGGFLPVPAALSVTVLLFVTNVFVSENYVRGEWITPAGGAFEVWVPGLRCRWTSVEDNAWATKWGARLDRRPAAVSRFHSDAGLFLEGDVDDAAAGFVRHLRHWYDGTTEKNLQATCYLGQSHDGVNPVDFTKEDIIWTNNNTLKDIPNVVHPIGRPGRHCFYQCVGWQPWSLPTFITNIGSISVGSAIVVQITGTISAYVGPKLVSTSTTTSELLTVFSRTHPRKEPANCMYKSSISHSKSFVALFLVSIYFVLKQFLVSKIDADGMYTVDYYVTFVMLLSAVVVCIIRIYHPYRCLTQSFTEPMWTKGEDTFVVTGTRKNHLLRNKVGVESAREMFGNDHAGNEDIDGVSILRDKSNYVDVQTSKNNENDVQLLTLDLMQWMHLTRRMRSMLLIDYARRPHRSTSLEEGFCATLARVKAMEVHDYEGSYHVTGEVVDVTPGEGWKLVGWQDEDTAVLERDSNKLENIGTGLIQIKSVFLVEVGVDWKNMTTKAKDYDVEYEQPHKELAEYRELYFKP